MVTELGRMATYLEEILNIKSGCLMTGWPLTLMGSYL